MTSSVMISVFTSLSGSTIDDFILNLEKQNIALDITSKENKMERLMHNGAIKVSRDNQVIISLDK